ncbi:DUF397 domain-containing protein [Streptomyces abikoensis]|uniref:DUF397 domain-containing protein n=1 Tax=Streptomyces abikoensis TaxID=97398 RepID=A0ABW7T1S6_9ACTN
MSTYHWQKSSYSGTASNCLNIAPVGDGTLRLRESDDPDVVLATSTASLRALIRAAKAGRLPAGGEWRLWSPGRSLPTAATRRTA